MANNKAIKARVKKYNLCYICEVKPGVLVDEVGGYLCAACNAGVQNMRQLYAVRGGYARREGGRGDVQQ